jgi:hypothetical protein
MESWANRKSFHESLAKSLAVNADGTAVEIQLSADISEWLGKLSLLYGVPLEYLVPDNRMLPIESIRFFYIDRNWIDRLIDGAMSVGVLSTKDQIFNTAFFKQVYESVDVAQLKTRALIRNEPPVTPSSIGGTITGLLIRSKVVSDYPGLEIEATDASGNKLEIIRMDRLSETLILCLFKGVPVAVDVMQPSEGLHFGLPLFKPGVGSADDTASIFIRGLGVDVNGYPGGEQIPKIPGGEDYISADVAFTGTAKGVVDFQKTVTNITTVFDTLANKPVGGPKPLTAGGLAIQMIVTKETQSYKITTPNGDAPDGCLIQTS